MNENDVRLLVEAMESGHVHLQSGGKRFRRMFLDNGVFEVRGQKRKYERVHKIASGDFATCLRELIGEDEK